MLIGHSNTLTGVTKLHELFWCCAVRNVLRACITESDARCVGWSQVRPLFWAEIRECVFAVPKLGSQVI